MIIFIPLFINSLIIRTPSDLNLNLKDVELVKDQSLQNVHIEDRGRHVTTDTTSPALVSEIATLLSKYKSPPSRINEIIKKINAKDETEEESLMTGKVSFIIFFLKSINESNIESKFNKQAHIYISTDENAAAEMGVPFPGLYGYYAPDAAEYRLEYSNFMQDISIVLTPVFSELTVESLKLYDDSLLPKFFLFYDEDKLDEFNAYKKEFENVARKYKEIIKTGILQYKKDKPSLGHFGVGEKELPAIVCVHEKNKYREINLTPEKLDSLFNTFKEGTLEPYEMSSEEVKDNDKRNVKEISRKNFKKYFYLNKNDKNENNDKDALLIFTSPHCRFCIDLKPILEKMGEAIKKNEIKDVIIGNVDLTVNDFPEFEVRGYPTIVLVSNGKKFYYSGNRTVEELSKFIKEKGKHRIDIITGEKEFKGEDQKDNELENEEIEDYIEFGMDEESDNVKEEL